MTFNLYLPKSGSRQNIYLSFTDQIQKKTYTFRTPLRISRDCWDQEKQRPYNIYLKKNKKLNARLNEIKKILAEHILKNRSLRKPPEQRTISKEINNICIEKKDIYIEKSLLYYMHWYINTKKEMICHSTYKRYMVFLRLLERFEGFLCKRLFAEEINSDFICDFIAFGKLEEYSESTIYRSIHFVKTILNFAERKGIRTAVRELEIRRERQKSEMVTLTEKEILTINNTIVPPELQAAKDWLMISCYTGQRFSDFMHFAKEKIKEIDGKTCISFVQKKTKKEIMMPLHPTVLHTIKRNNNQFPKLLNIHHYNNHIKEIARIAKINEPVNARKRLGYRTRNVLTEKWNSLTSHIGRRSFATNFYGKIPTPLLMEATGHSTEEMFIRYINPLNWDKVLTLGRYFDKIYEESLMAI